MPEEQKYKNFDELKCLWMECNVVDYKLCDNNFECENCEFDREFKSRLNKKENIREEIESIFDSGHYTVAFNHPHYHFDCGLVLKNFLDNIYYVGLELYIVKLIDTASKINYLSSKDIINRGEPILSIKNGWGEVNLISPIGFRFIERLNPGNLFSNGIKWFAIIEVEKSDINNYSIGEKKYFDKLYETKMMMKDYALSTEMAGVTMYDGGTPFEHWSDIMGKENYRKLMKKVLT
jgi:hypothetical protein